ncbi:MAG: deoxynucleoside kinase [Chloroflexi bacterium]|nr:deoxynucleoside kinase [Chloroflexota bacterium]
MTTKQFVLVAGNIGAGKTSLTERIGERLGWYTAMNPSATTPIWPIFMRI